MTDEQKKICARRGKELWAIFAFIFLVGAATGYAVATVQAELAHEQRCEP